MDCLFFPGLLKSRDYARPVPELHYQEPSTPTWAVPGTGIETTANTCLPSGEVLSSAEEAARRDKSDKSAQLPRHSPEKLRRQTRCAYWPKVTVSGHQRWETALLYTSQTSEITRTLHKEKNSTAPSLEPQTSSLAPRMQVIPSPALSHFREWLCCDFWSQNEQYLQTGE